MNAPESPLASRRLLGAVLAAVAVLALAGAQGALAESRFSDPVGDAGTAPDITAVVVSNDAAGRVTIRVEIANQPTMAADAEIDIFLDTDVNTATGFEGSEYILSLWDGGATWGFVKWNGSAWDPDTPSTSVSVTYNSGATFAIDRSELGGTAGFNFWVGAFQVAGDEIVAADEAPDTALWLYQLAVNPTPVAPPKAKPYTLLAPKAVPLETGGPRAGASFTVLLPVTRSDTGAALASGKVVCRARLGAAPLAVRSKALAVGAGRCAFLLPKSARGKLLVVTVTVSSGGKLVSRSYAGRVR